MKIRDMESFILQRNTDEGITGFAEIFDADNIALANQGNLNHLIKSPVMDGIRSIST